MLLIGIYPHLQAIGLECPLWVYPTPEEGDPRSKLDGAADAARAFSSLLSELTDGRFFEFLRARGAVGEEAFSESISCFGCRYASDASFTIWGTSVRWYRHTPRAA